MLHQHITQQVVMISCFIQIGPNKVLLLAYTYHIRRHIFQNYTINWNLFKMFDLELVSNNSSNEYDIQAVYNSSSFIGTFTELQHAFLAMYDTHISPFSYSGSETLILHIIICR